MPSKIELLAKMVGSMKAPISGFVNVMKGNLRGLVQVLNAIKDNK
jgi:large subunit ribosomal protein L10